VVKAAVTTTQVVDEAETIQVRTDLVETDLAREREEMAPEVTVPEEIGQVLMGPMAIMAVDLAPEMAAEMVLETMVAQGMAGRGPVAGELAVEEELVAVVFLGKCLGPAAHWNLKVELSPKQI
jgi:hypothetical protein